MSDHPVAIPVNLFGPEGMTDGHPVGVDLVVMPATMYNAKGEGLSSVMLCVIAPDGEKIPMMSIMESDLPAFTKACETALAHRLDESINRIMLGEPKAMEVD